MSCHARNGMLPQDEMQARVITAKCTYSERAAFSAAAVDQLADGVGVVDEVLGQSRVGDLLAVVVDEGLEVVGNLLCILVGHAVGSGLLGAPGRPRCGGCMGSGCEGGKCEDGTHVGGNVLVGVRENFGA